ncbi:Response regulator receiver domain-containing protein [Nannocystis exedens]|uniref:Response regulator receiver domain-containing protein n=1 Tax=Nannocystis exedens TaxID=54 RepID=A0A1I1UBD8_9BACT|nr:response regulator [Nannocystis exedens]PCC71567.1 Response regulator protein TodT [Nannocystis exedens]SFD68004.1 Response regulator receiver domain-containing protein [Nannocystis exedens]
MSDERLIGIVDDDASLRRSLGNLLGSTGFNVETFASAEAFLQAGKAEAMDALVLDVRMPGMSGVDLLVELGRRDSRLPVVVLTAHGDDDVRKQCLRAGALAFLTKPFQAQELLDAIERVTSGE